MYGEVDINVARFMSCIPFVETRIISNWLTTKHQTTQGLDWLKLNAAWTSYVGFHNSHRNSYIHVLTSRL